MARIRIALAQSNPTVGALDANLESVLATIDRAEAEHCDVVVFPELTVTGYPPEDLLLKPGFVAANLRALEAIAAHTGACAAVVGFVDADRDLYNAAAVCAGGRIQGLVRKRLLPNYGVFDEARYFVAGDVRAPGSLFRIAGVNVGVSICEDVWSPDGPLAVQAAGGAEVHLNLNGSPFERGKQSARERMLGTRASDANCALVYVNQVGGQDELVFDGGSLVIDPRGEVVARCPRFVEHLGVVDVQVEPVYRKRLIDPRGRPTRDPLPVVTVSEVSRAAVLPLRVEASDPLEPDAELFEALVVGTRGYVRKNGFSDVVIGLSGGIDSALVAAVAVEALGPAHVHGVSMPSRYSSEGSRTDAQHLAINLGIDLRTVSIEPAFQAYLDMLRGGDAPLPGLTEENLQSRCRGTTLMALSNAYGWMVLTTGNKSEMAVGYFTLYGDSVGGFAVIKDVLKTRVYDLCRFVNARAGRSLIPDAIVDKPPSAELRPDQRDDQSLPPYEVLDPVLEGYVDADRTAAELIESGHDPEVVHRVARLVDMNEYKRRQCPPGVRVTGKAFGKDRRLPITNGFSEAAGPPR